MMNEKVETVMIKKLITLSPLDTLDHATKIFSDKRIHHLPVQDDGKLVGLVTTYDIWKISMEKSLDGSTLVRDIMSKKVVKINPDDKIGTAAELFLDNRFHALPVVTDDNYLVGLVTTFDVLRYEFKKEYPDPILYKDELEHGME
ncbi:MAG: CBS domain-containing protein [Saprospiraceae bacterium]|nr:CBS domain-containing protein [Saprospiraceae bacterium]